MKNYFLHLPSSAEKKIISKGIYSIPVKGPSSPPMTEYAVINIQLNMIRTLTMLKIVEITRKHC